jgi:predicted CXXCH cytochrome family protein
MSKTWILIIAFIHVTVIILISDWNTVYPDSITLSGKEKTEQSHPAAISGAAGSQVLSLTYTSSKFTSSEEYLSHIKGSASCLSQQCHAEFMDQSKFIHSPVFHGKCEECHSAEAYPNKFGLELDQRTTCSRCHKVMENEINSNTFVHGPVKNGDCTSCHDPHQSIHPFFLRQSYNKLCISCHKQERLFTGKNIHKPAKDGNCGVCHDPHASNFKNRLVDAGVNLCVICHEIMITGMAKKYIHTPIIKSGCNTCHDPHASTFKSRLKKSKKQICFSCHEEKKREVEQYNRRHAPAYEGNCLACHSPHYSEDKNLLIDKIDTLCINCHKETTVWREKRFKHGPVVQGNCTACHNPHGSDNAFILRLPFPHTFYSAYDKGKYSLCFLCHVESLVTVEKTTAITRFRNGETNLHWLHVKQKKGRTCRACHDVHASEHKGRIRDSFLFGTIEIDFEYDQTDTGGSCLAGCHEKRSYDRENQVNYAR